MGDMPLTFEVEGTFCVMPPTFGGGVEIQIVTTGCQILRPKFS